MSGVSAEADLSRSRGHDDPILAVENLRVEYRTSAGPIVAVNDVSFNLGSGERLGLIGESGSGKTTMATALMRLTPRPGRITAGRIVLRGRDLATMPERQLRQLRLKEIALIPQGAMNSLNPVMRVGPQIVDAIEAHEGRRPRTELLARIGTLLGRVGLPPPVADRYPHQLSGGMRQRVVMAIATALSPAVIVADEPTSALDVVVQRQVMLTLGRLQVGLNAAVVLIGHDMGLIAQFADTIGVMYAGKLVEIGPVAEIIAKPEHPYTRLLIESLPRLDVKRELRGIPGLPPELLHLPAGCSFHPRCPYAFEPCSRAVPLLGATKPGREVACHLFSDHESSAASTSGSALNGSVSIADVAMSRHD